MQSIIILYVTDQEKSKNFYQYILGFEPCLHVPGMTEFELGVDCKLGLMPENGISKILKDTVPHPSEGNGIPRCEVYLLSDQAERFYQRALELAAIDIQSFQNMDWGHKVAYVADPDGHVLAFAKEII